MTFKLRFLSAIRTLPVTAALALTALAPTAFAQHNLPGGGWTYDPGKDGMKDLRALKPIEGCLKPGGLQKVTSSDEPGTSVNFWCGTPPFCLTDAAMVAGRHCTIVPYSRRSPRGDPNGTPSANPVRDPQDLRCVNTGLQPINGKCPLPPTVSATLNGQANLTVRQDTNVTLTVNSPEATMLRQDCSGVNDQITPVNDANLDSLAGRSATYGPGMPLGLGTTNCTITATNDRGTATANTSLTITARPSPPSVSASFNPTDPKLGGEVSLSTATSGATDLAWSCTGLWTNSNTPRTTGALTTSHSVGSVAGSTTCTFTASGPGGTATAEASWSAAPVQPDKPVKQPTYHYPISCGESGGSGNGGNLNRFLYWYPSDPVGNCTTVNVIGMPGYSEARTHNWQLCGIRMGSTSPGRECR